MLSVSGVFPIALVRYVNSATKSAMACPLMVVLGMNLISNSLRSITHLVNLPDTSGFCKTCRREWLVGTNIRCAWKYGRSFLAATTSASASFSIYEYLVSISWKALQHSRWGFELLTVCLETDRYNIKSSPTLGLANTGMPPKYYLSF